ncbi:MAG: hypothetical protein CSA75_02135 [Sorangium cellulosum]|nr:MAG: hypothetical protein CSA75_02135 [Sorangium cellulosum]
MKGQFEKVSWDDLTPPTPQELKEARALREALEGQGEHPDAELCRALQIANDPPELDPQVNKWLVKRAILRTKLNKRTTFALVGASSALALAAGVALVVSGGGLAEPPPSTPMVKASLIPSRSTQTLFHSPFQRHGGTSERIDRISRARGRDYRSNYYGRIGVLQ